MIIAEVQFGTQHLLNPTYEMKCEKGSKGVWM